MNVGDYVLYEDKLWKVYAWGYLHGDFYLELTMDIRGSSGAPVMRTSRRVMEHEVIPITKEVADIMGGVDEGG